MKRQTLWACMVVWATASGAALAQDLRAQCNVQNATEVLQTVFAQEVRQSPVYAAVLADTNAAPIKAAINDCQAGREGGGRSGMEKWISNPQNRQYYLQAIINPALAQSPQLRRQIESVYQDAFGRAPTPGEIDFWSKDPRAAFPTQMMDAHRAWLRSGNEAQATITRSYQDAYKRTPSAEELKFWSDQIRSRGFTFAELVNTHRDYLRQNPGANSQANALANSAQWRQQLEATYQQAFGRTPSQGEIEFWAKDPRANNQAQILAAHRDFLKAGNELDPTITRSYQEALKRTPSAEELNHWRDQVRRNGLVYRDLMDLHRQFIAQNPSALNPPKPAAPPTTSAPPPPPPAPPTTNTAQRDPSCDQGFYVIDGTSSEYSSQNLMVHFYRWAQPAGSGCRLIKRYFAGIGLVQGEGVDDIHRDAMTIICQDLAGRSAETQRGEPWRVRSIGVLGYSRGAIVALNLVNNLQSRGCPEGAVRTPIRFLGLVDAVRTSMPAWQGDLTARVDSAVHVHKKQEWSIDPNRVALWTHQVGNIRSVTIDTTEHGTMNCARQTAASNSTENEIYATAVRAGFKFPERTFFGPCGAPNHDAWKAPASSRYRSSVLVGP